MESSLESKTTEQLQSNLMMLKTVTITLGVVLLLLVSISLYGLITKDNNGTFIPLLAVGVSLSGMIPIQIISMKKVKDELKKREASA